ncbi:MAG TPA: M20 family metallopeptidase [Thermoanaerobaculia bacterium]|jgi:glutamate carboxypeptidase|nr:M20 family metallopeptidase [Thermoanaerobaculia bacterium]
MTTISPAILLSHLRALQGEMVALLSDLARAETPSVDPASQEPVLARLAVELAKAGLAVRRLKGRTSGGQLWAAPPRGSRRAQGAQLLIGHCDTVWPHGTLATMPLEIRDGKLTGPGVFDMKGGLVQGVFALRALRELGAEPPLIPAFFINSDEEIGSGDSTVRILRLARRMQRVFVLEPALGSEGRLKTRRKGSLRFDLRIEGKAAHSGLDPDKGASAILEMAHVIRRLDELTDREKGVSINIGVIKGGTRRNVIAAEATAELDVRVLTLEDAERIDRIVRTLKPVTPGTSIHVEGGMDRPPLEATPGNRVLWNQAQKAARELGIELGEGTSGGASDGSFTSQLVPTLDGLGPVGDGAHAVHEHVEISRMPERAALLGLLLMTPPLAERI